jgi:hypothetical protein
MKLAWGLLVVLLAIAPARAETQACPVPPDLALTELSLPAAKAAVAAKHLVIMTMGGAATLGMAAGGAEFSWPTRLAGRLRQELPGVDISVVSHAASRQSAGQSLRHLDKDLEQTGAKLVIWSAGAAEAGAGVDEQQFADELERGIAKIQAAGADVIMMDVQYAPSIARVVNLAPYRDAVLRVGVVNDIAVLDRYELMREWGDDNVLNFDVTDPAGRIEVARRLFDCLAQILAEGIVPAVR